MIWRSAAFSLSGLSFGHKPVCALEFALAPLIPDSSTAEQSTVNRQVLGSNPSQGA